MFEKFSTPARNAVVGAQEQARELRAPRIDTPHLVLSLLADADSRPAEVLVTAGVTYEATRRRLTARQGPSALGAEDAAALDSIGIDLDAVRASLEATFGEGALDREPPRREKGLLARWSGHIGFTPGARKAIELSLREALARKDRAIGPEHLLLGVLRAPDDATRELLEIRVSVTELRERLLAAMDERAA